MWGSGEFSADDGEIIGDHAPADPTLKAIFAMIATAVEAMFAFEYTDASFNAVVEATPTAEPGLGFMLAASVRLMAGFGQDDTFDTLVLSIGFVDGRVETSVATGLVGWFTKAAAMAVESWLPLGVIRRIALEDRPVADEATIDLIQPDFVPKLGFLANLVATNDGGVRLKEADKLLRGRDAFPAKDAAHGLVDEERMDLQGASEATLAEMIVAAVRTRVG